MYKRQALPGATRPSRPRDRATPASHGGTKSYRRKNGPQRETRRAGSAERAPFPIPDFYVRTPMVELCTTCFTPPGNGAHRDIERGKLRPDRIGGDIIASTASHVRGWYVCGWHGRVSQQNSRGAPCAVHVAASFACGIISYVRGIKVVLTS